MLKFASAARLDAVCAPQSRILIARIGGIDILAGRVRGARPGDDVLARILRQICLKFETLFDFNLRSEKWE